MINGKTKRFVFFRLLPETKSIQDTVDLCLSDIQRPFLKLYREKLVKMRKKERERIFNCFTNKARSYLKITKYLYGL